ncbi:hypothetical protein PAESOLCIP111_06728 [Paenibacillus solanacearum]|uniref:DZANK-type domain-containing protein n=1 Tax=Paenibacillus solanacearum TaxID=2048548 RepID=A0A916K8F4_9BACL|nr:hypothetical protein [Paenibacillus solanacearum]CAG7653256.1 hypothetical protein PAESOLCIP111_06728 [Paenibacillus solanacearum]
MDLYICPVCKSKNHEKEKYCTQCGTWLLSDAFPAQKVKMGTQPDRLYICAFCDTANEPWRNACKKCLKPLFGTEYVTKEIKVIHSSALLKFLKVIMFILSGITILFGLMLYAFSVDQKLLSIPLTLLVLTFIQLLFGLISPTLFLVRKGMTRGKLFGICSLAIIILFFTAAKLSPQQQINRSSIEAVAATPKDSEKASSDDQREQFINSTKQIPYIDLARNPDKFKGEHISYQGQVVQVLEQGNYVGLRVNVTKGAYDIWQDTVFVNYRKQSGEDRILEKDIIDLWGDVKGLKTYKTVLGSETAIPEIDAKYITIKENKKP